MRKGFKMKIAVVVDSNSGITLEEAPGMGLYVLPMPFSINGETFEEGISLTQEEFYRHQLQGDDITTSQPSPETVIKLWDELLRDHDQIVHIPMSSGLSGSCQTALMLAEDYGGKVQVANNQRISITQRQAALDAVAMARMGMDAAAIRKELERTKMDSSIYVILDTLKYLKKGGRITPAAAALGALLRIKPVLQIQGEKLDAFSKARTMKQGKNIMLSAVAHDLETRYGDPEAEHTWLAIAHSCNEEAAKEFAREVRQIYPKTHEIHIVPLSLSVVCHTGPGCLAIGCSKELAVKAE